MVEQKSDTERLRRHRHRAAGPKQAQRPQGNLRHGPAQDDNHLRVAATPGSLLAMLVKRDDEGVSPGKVEIAGDADLARRLEKLASKFAPDFEEAFARTFGDVLGVPLAKAVRSGLAHAKETASHLTTDTADWLRDEARLAAAPGEVEGFLDGHTLGNGNVAYHATNVGERGDRKSVV